MVAARLLEVGGFFDDALEASAFLVAAVLAERTIVVPEVAAEAFDDVVLVLTCRLVWRVAVLAGGFLVPAGADLTDMAFFGLMTLPGTESELLSGGVTRRTPAAPLMVLSLGVAGVAA